MLAPQGHPTAEPLPPSSQLQSVSVFMVRAFHTVVLDISSEMLISEGSALQGIFHRVGILRMGLIPPDPTALARGTGGPGKPELS